jgi:hypothetical protein
VLVLVGLMKCVCRSQFSGPAVGPERDNTEIVNTVAASQLGQVCVSFCASFFDSSGNVLS